MANNFNIKDITNSENNMSNNKNILDDDYYTPLTLSTQNRIYAPSKLNIKTFSMQDIRLLALQETSYISTLCDILNKNIKENQGEEGIIIDTKKFTLNELIELMFKFYGTFISPTIDYNYTPTEEEINSMADTQLKKDLITKKWQPKIKIIINNLSTYNSQEDLNKLKLEYTYKRNSIEIKFHIITLRDYINILEFSKYNKSQRDSSLAIRLSCINSYNSLNFSNLDINSKIELYNNNIFQIDDFDLDNVLNYLSKINIGLRPSIKIQSPISQKEVVFDTPSFFSINTILQTYIFTILNEHSTFTII